MLHTDKQTDKQTNKQINAGKNIYLLAEVNNNNNNNNNNSDNNNNNKTITITIVREALFCLGRGTNIYNSFGGVSEFQDTYHGFLYFLTFLVFLSGFFILLVREKHRKTLYRFLLAKIKGWDKNNRDKNSEYDNDNKNKWQAK